MKLSSIEKQFSNQGAIRGGTLLLKAFEAMQLINICQEKKVNILGIDAFIIKDDKTQPILDHSIDFTLSENDSTTLFFDEALEFLKKHLNSNLHFEVVLDTD